MVSNSLLATTHAHVQSFIYLVIFTVGVARQYDGKSPSKTNVGYNNRG